MQSFLAYLGLAGLIVVLCLVFGKGLVMLYLFVAWLDGRASAKEDKRWQRSLAERERHRRRAEFLNTPTGSEEERQFLARCTEKERQQFLATERKRQQVLAAYRAKGQGS
jgi:hypothetical protein